MLTLLTCDKMILGKSGPLSGKVNLLLVLAVWFSWTAPGGSGITPKFAGAIPVIICPLTLVCIGIGMFERSKALLL